MLSHPSRTRPRTEWANETDALLGLLHGWDGNPAYR
jgi:hypothetical protein